MSAIPLVRHLALSLLLIAAAEALAMGTPSARAQAACALSSSSVPQPNEGPTDYNLHLPPTGELSAVMLFVDFSDAASAESTNSLYELLVPNAVRWFSDASYGNTSLRVTPVHRWYRMPKPSTDYPYARGLSFDQHRGYIADAINAADAEVDFSPYRIVYIVASETPAISFSPTFHAYAGTGVNADGVEIRHAVTLGGDIRSERPNYGSHVLIHETGHLLGLPDLYLFGTPLFDGLRYIGGWDIMGWLAPGAQFLAWHKLKLGWLTPDQVICLTTAIVTDVVLTPLEVRGGVKAAIVRTSPSSAYVMEVRQNINQDAGLCDRGVLIYSVDATARNGDGPIRLRAAQSGSDSTMLDRCGPLYDAPFDLGAGETSRFSDSTVPLIVDITGRTGNDYRLRISFR
jgi:M6 family metalloprotease-like protein